MKVIAFPRTEQGSGASRRLRRAGHTPGIVYGGPAAPVNVSLDHNALFHALKKEAFHSSILDLEVDGKSEKVLLRDFQMHAFKPLVLHADFQRVDPNQKIHMKVPLHFINAEISPAIKLSGGIISHVMNEIDVQCVASKLPSHIEVDLSAIVKGQSIHAGELVLPEGVTLVNHGHSGELTVVTAVAPKGGATTTDAAGEAAE